MRQICLAACVRIAGAAVNGPNGAAAAEEWGKDGRMRPEQVNTEWVGGKGDRMDALPAITSLQPKRAQPHIACIGAYWRCGEAAMAREMHRDPN